MSLDQARRLLEQLGKYPQRDENGYKQVLLDGEWRWLHRIVATEKIGAVIYEGFEVHHIDGDKQNNDPSNLQVLSKEEHQKLHMVQDSDVDLEIDKKAIELIHRSVETVLKNAFKVDSDVGIMNERQVNMYELTEKKLNKSDQIKYFDNIQFGFRKSACSRCGGSGYLLVYSHVEGGICFNCNGSGQA